MRICQIYFLFLIIFTSCNHSNKEYVTSVIKSYKVKEPFELNVQKGELLGALKFINIYNKETLYFFNKNNDSLYLFDIETDKIYQKIFIDKIEQEFPNSNRLDCKIINSDSIIFYSYENQKLIITDFQGVIKYSISFSEFLEPNEETLAYWDRGMEYQNGLIDLILIYNDLVLNSKLNFKKYFSRKCNLIIDLKSNKYYSFLNFPSNMRNGEYYGELDYYSLTFQDFHMYSFPYSDSVYLYKKNEFYKTVFMGTYNEKEFNIFDINKTTDYRYTNNFRTTQPMYKKLFYNKYNKKFYRIYKHSGKVNNGVLQKDSEIKWSLISMDKNFNYVDETEIDTKLYTPYIVEAVKEGILISKNLNNLDAKYLEFDVIKF